MGLAVANLAVAAALAGLIWTIQLVHYPLFARVDAAGWTAYEAEHQRRITWLAAPLMLLDVGLAAALVLAGGALPGLRWAALALGTGTFAATGLLFSPLHGRLGQAHDPALMARLVAWNRWRTAAWTLRAALAIWLVLALA
jgi:multisubunit Na+/H+ antiporter MnhB subunit